MPDETFTAKHSYLCCCRTGVVFGCHFTVVVWCEQLWVLLMAEKTSNAERTREYYRKQGEQRERERILYILETTPIVGVGDVEIMQVGRQHLIDLVKGENK